MFKKILALTAALALAPVVMANNFGQGGFQGPGATSAIVKVSELGGFGMDDRPVILEGNVIQQLNHEIYKFSDGTGTVNVEFDDDMMLPTFNSNTRVRLYGEVDSEFRGNKVDVQRIEVL